MYKLIDLQEISNEHILHAIHIFSEEEANSCCKYVYFAILTLWACMF